MELTNVQYALLVALAAGMSMPAGAMMSANRWIRSLCFQLELDSFVSYFGGGALLAAVALVLVPEGMEALPVATAGGSFLAGGVVFWLLDGWVKRRGGAVSQFTGMLLDFIPESLVLGAAVASGSSAGALLAGLIALQNMPEGFASYHEMREGGMRAGPTWAAFLAAPAAGPVSAWVGYACLALAHTALGIVMLFCSGGILYLIFQDIAPGAHLRHRDFPAIGAVSGFLLGMVGAMLVH